MSDSSEKPPSPESDSVAGSLKGQLEIKKLQAEIAKVETETRVLKRPWLAHGPNLQPVLVLIAAAVTAFSGWYSGFFDTKRVQAEMATEKSQRARDEARQEAYKAEQVRDEAQRQSIKAQVNLRAVQAATSQQNQENALLRKDLETQKATVKQVSSELAALRGSADNVASLQSQLRGALDKLKAAERFNAMERWRHCCAFFSRHS